MLDIYDTLNLDDLPPELRKELRDRCLNLYDEKIASLFYEKKELSIDEVLIALYRKYQLIKKRTWVSNRFYYMSKRKIIKKVSKGHYKLINN